ncbi:VaFE repeat-containing surface-anchored protein, partial [Corynebacterium sp. zg-331]|uniref:DUF7507 domain-containing protein n=1 Tax=unclassified Corynebacterium TaxID=2624378 RepID=UPI00164329EC|nr:VaFE repeat-containing surface-anchored protein [Corynebacterium sp. zg-331]
MAPSDVVFDTVKVENIVPGKKYVLEGVLKKKSDSSDLGTSKPREFTSADLTGLVENADGSVSGSIVIQVPGASALQPGESGVVFERLTSSEVDASGNDLAETPGEPVEIAKHENIDDAAQTVTVTERPEEPKKDFKPAVSTSASFSEEKDEKSVEGVAPSDVVFDTVKVENIVPGKKYVLEGVLKKKSDSSDLGTSKPREFTSADLTGLVENADGSVSGSIVIQVPGASALQPGESGVVFERLTSSEVDASGNDLAETPGEPVEIAKHENIDDAAQTVTVTERPEEPTPGTPKIGLKKYIGTEVFQGQEKKQAEPGAEGVIDAQTEQDAFQAKKAGDELTVTFVVTNVGDTNVFDLKLQDRLLAIDKSQTRVQHPKPATDEDAAKATMLAPGESVTFIGTIPAPEPGKLHADEAEAKGLAPKPGNPEEPGTDTVRSEKDPAHALTPEEPKEEIPSAELKVKKFIGTEFLPQSQDAAIDFTIVTKEKAGTKQPVHDTGLDTVQDAQDAQSKFTNFTPDNRELKITVVVKNTGETTLKGVTVEDVLPNPDESKVKVESFEEIAFLAPGETARVTGTITAAEAEKLNLHADYVEAMGTPVKSKEDPTPIAWVDNSGNTPVEKSPEEKVASNKDTAYAQPKEDTPPVQPGEPKIALKKYINGEDAQTEDEAVKATKEGENLTVTFVVKNVGDVNVFNLEVRDRLLATDDSKVWVKDPKPATDEDAAKATMLAPGESVTFTGTIPAPKPGDLHADEAEAKGLAPKPGNPEEPGTDTVRSEKDPAHAVTPKDTPKSGLSLKKYIGDREFRGSEKPQKSGDKEFGSSGVLDAQTQDRAYKAKADQDLTITYVVTNVGETTMTDVSISKDDLIKDVDTAGQAIDLVKVKPATVKKLAPGKSETFTVTLPALGAEKVHGDVAQAQGKPVDDKGNPVTTFVPVDEKGNPQVDEKGNPLVQDVPGSGFVPSNEDPAHAVTPKDAQKADIQLKKYIGDKTEIASIADAEKLNDSQEKKTAHQATAGADLTVAFVVKNTGDLTLKDVATPSDERITKAFQNQLDGTRAGLDKKTPQVTGIRLAEFAGNAENQKLLKPGEKVVFVADLKAPEAGKLHADKAKTSGTPVDEKGNPTSFVNAKGKPQQAGTPVESNEDQAHALTPEAAKPVLKTSAKFNGKDKVVVAGATIVDKVTYSGLVPGKAYTLEAQLIERKGEKKPFTTGAVVGSGSQKFTADKHGKGKVEVPIVVNSDVKKPVPAAVAFETLTSSDEEALAAKAADAVLDGSPDKGGIVVLPQGVERGGVIAVHHDINDKKQTVTSDKGMVQPARPTKPTPGKPEGDNPEENTTPSDDSSEPGEPKLELKKYINDNDAQDWATAEALKPGEKATVKFVVINTGGVDLFNIALSDKTVEGVGTVENIAPEQIDRLNVGESAEFTGELTLAEGEEHKDVAKAEGVPPSPENPDEPGVDQTKVPSNEDPAHAVTPKPGEESSEPAKPKDKPAEPAKPGKAVAPKPKPGKAPKITTDAAIEGNG